jgi:hypothetical protein
MALSRIPLQHRILSFLLFLYPFSLYSGSLILRLPSSISKTITIIGFSGMKELNLGILTVNAEGTAFYKGDYEGFIMIEIDSKGSFPVILKQETVEFTLDKNEYPQFTDEENTWLYKSLSGKRKTEQQEMTLINNLSYFPENDPYYALLKRKQTEIDSLKTINEKRILSDNRSLASLILQGQQLIESTYGIKTTTDLKDRKKAMLDFLVLHFKRLYHTDMFRQTAFQYAMMNEYVAKSREEHYGYVIADIGDWITRLDGKLSPEEITEFFVTMAAGRRMISLASEILAKYARFTGCPVSLSNIKKSDPIPDFPVHLWKSSDQVPLSKAGAAKKLLIFYDEDCVFCLPAHVRLMNLLQNKSLTITVITVFAGKKSPEEMDELARPRQFNYWYRDDPSLGSLLGSFLQLVKYPAFVIIDPATTNTRVLYSGDEAITELVKP